MSSQNRYHARNSKDKSTIVYLENAWTSKQMITKGEAAIPLETTLHAFRNQEKTKQRSTIVLYLLTATLLY